MRPPTEALPAVPYAALRATCEALLPPSAPADVRAWGAGALSALTTLAGGTRARLVLRVNGRAYAWGEALTDASGHAGPAGARCPTVGVAVATPDAAGEATFVCALPPDDAGADGSVRAARAAAILSAVRPVLRCAVELRARGARPEAAPAGDAPTAESAAADLLRDHFALTCREREVVRLLLLGQRNDEVARALGISPHTARHHTEHVLGKLGVDSRAAIAALAARLAARLAAAPSVPPTAPRAPR